MAESRTPASNAAALWGSVPRVASRLRKRERGTIQYDIHCKVPNLTTTD